jgi:tRNA(Ile2)-agmatinylcytidine synthase
MCTTFLVFNLARHLLERKKTTLIDYPNLIRLNPNIPWKTRGNASLVLRIESELGRFELFRICEKFVRRFATSSRANAGLVIFEGEKIPEKIVEYSRFALFGIQSLSKALSLMDGMNMLYLGLRNKQGLVGALAGIGNELKDDFTFELIAYRNDCKVKRNVDESKVIEMDRKTKPLTFNSYDALNKRVLITPHGRDPVLLGIRGETPQSVKEAFQMLLPLENLLGYMIFRSNQGTGEHLEHNIDLSSVKAYFSGKLLGTVSTKPRVERGGHVFFRLRNEKGDIMCAAYEPTGDFRSKVSSLVEGDVIEVGGGIRRRTQKHERVLNLEYFIPKELIPSFAESNPVCPKCFRRMKSLGQDQGFGCDRCSFHSRFASKSRTEIKRRLRMNKLYLPDLKAHRHLTKPMQRYNNLKLRSRSREIDEFFEKPLANSVIMTRRRV